MAATRPPSEVAAKGAYTDDLTIILDPQPMSSWVGWSVFAAILLVMAGVFQAIAGLVALFNSTYYAVSSSGLAVSASYTAWGWVHLVVGVALVCAGFSVLRGHLYGRVIGVVIAMLSAISNLVFLQAAPVWGAIIITIDVLVIYALTVHGSVLKAASA